VTETVKIVIPDAGPINTLAAAGLLHLLMAPKNTEIVVIQSVYNEILSRSSEFIEFLKGNPSRIKFVKTSVCLESERKLTQGEPIGKGRGDLAIADFIMNFIDKEIGNSPALVIFEDKKLGRLSQLEDYSENTHFITTAAYLKKLEIEGIIESFESIWELVVRTNSSSNPNVHRVPNPMEFEQPSRQGSSIFRHR
jgi:hypothetical protein